MEPPYSVLCKWKYLHILYILGSTSVDLHLGSPLWFINWLQAPELQILN